MGKKEEQVIVGLALDGKLDWGGEITEDTGDGLTAGGGEKQSVS